MRELKRIALFILILILPIFLIDYYVDSYASFRVTYKKIGKLSTKSNYCTGTQIPLSERKAKWATLCYLEPVDYIILGSSRSMQFAKDNLRKESFYNLSVSGGCTVQDYFSEVYILEQMDKMPSYILIEVSPALFNANSGEIRYLEWGNSYEYMKGLMSGDTNPRTDETYLLGTQIKNIVSPAYFKYNFQKLLEGKRLYIEPNSQKINETLATQMIDGSYSYSGQYRVQNEVDDILTGTSKICSEHIIYHCSDFNDLDDDLICQFEHLIVYLNNKGVTVSLYLPPYTSYMYEYICEDKYYSEILNVEDYVLGYAADNNIQVYGSFNPENSNLQLTDMYDEYHVKPEKIRDTLWPRFDDLENLWNNIGVE